jgi:hypothetical protein
MPAKHLSSSYSIEVTIPQFTEVDNRDKAGAHIHVRWFGLSTLLEETLDFYNIQYNIHFGSTIFFHVLVEDQSNIEFAEEVILQYANNVPLSDILEYIDAKIGVKENCISRLVAENEFLFGLNETFD